MIKYVNAEYIESGTFVSGEEDCYNLDLKPMDEVIVMKKSDFQKITGSQMMVNGEPTIFTLIPE